MKEVSALTRAISNLFYVLRYEWYNDSSCDEDMVHGDNYMYTQDYMIYFKPTGKKDYYFTGEITIKTKIETFTEEDLQKSLEEIEKAIQRDLTFIRTYIYPPCEVDFDDLFIVNDKKENEKSWSSKFKYISPNEVRVYVQLYDYEDVEELKFFGLHLYLLGGMETEDIEGKFSDILDILEDYHFYEYYVKVKHPKYSGLLMNFGDFYSMYHYLYKKYYEKSKDEKIDEHLQEYEKYYILSEFDISELIQKEMEYYKDYSNFNKPDKTIRATRKDYYTEEEYNQIILFEEKKKKQKLEELQREEDLYSEESNLEEVHLPVPKTKTLPKVNVSTFFE